MLGTPSLGPSTTAAPCAWGREKLGNMISQRPKSPSASWHRKESYSVFCVVISPDHQANVTKLGGVLPDFAYPRLKHCTPLSSPKPLLSLLL